MAAFREDVNANKTGINLQYAPKKASQVMTENEFLTRDSSGNLTPASGTSANIVGIALNRVVATDADYASTSTIAYDEPREGEVFRVAVDNASAAGFVVGVSRELLNAGKIKAAAVTGTATVVIKKIFTATNEALVTIKTPTL